VPVATAIVPNRSSDVNAQRLTMTAQLENASLTHLTEQSVLAMLSVRAPPAPEEDSKRPAMDLVACIDRSGSMRGPKMRLMKQTLELLVKRAGLKHSDRFSIVTFDSSVKVDVPLEYMDSQGRSRAEDVIKGIREGSTTNLSGGALRAIDILDASASQAPATAGTTTSTTGEQGRTRAVMLFTDGLANEGIRDTASLVAAVKGALDSASEKLGGPISFFTFGFGADHNEDCLRTLATESSAGGLYYYVNAAEDIPNAFADVIGGLSSVVAQNAVLTLAPEPGVSVARVLGSTYTRDTEGAIVLGDLFAEDAKDVLVELTVPALPTPTDAQTILRAQLKAFNVVKSAPETVEASLELARPHDTPTSQTPNTAIDEQRNRIQAADAMEQASLLADRGDLEGGRQKLMAARRRIADSTSAATPLSFACAKEMDELEVQYRSMSQYRSVGSKMSKMHASSHYRQRAVHSNADVYSAGSKRKAAMKASWMGKLLVEKGDSDDDE